jgi:excisionase family DNA binding protein
MCHLEALADVRAVAEAFGVCPETIRRLVRHGKLKAIHVGRQTRFTRAEIERFLSAASDGRDAMSARTRELSSDG